MNALDLMLEKAAKENQKAEAKRPAPNKDELAKFASYLKGWAKKKPIVRESAGSTFWRSGKYMTKIDFKMADALVKGGYATLSGNSKEAGAVLHMK